ncbi:magnesium transporter CorA family protein [Actinomadura rayongensis]|uniref:Magnesium transporter n=1 Tax=Actinomadura rayongensis TaxID=1429076 RepID=A0A6I4WI77_9ACTN|nr:magnesium transporter CorA family protein [Actinomadura rayongensis]MXQ68055.1 magnesium transporter [Actinomadura rayongensis]
MTSDPSQVRTRQWRGGKTTADDFPLTELRDRVAPDDAAVWVDLRAPSHDDLRLVADVLGLDHVALEDAVTRRERTKLDRYDGYIFLNLYAASATKGRLALHEVSAFVCDRALVTVRDDDAFDMDGLVRRWDDDLGMWSRGVADEAENVRSLLLYGLLDQVVDGQLDAVQALDDETDAVEELVFDDAPQGREIQHRSFRLRKNLAALRRVALPMREILSTLLRRDTELVPNTMRPYYQDVYDHALHVGEWTDGLRDLVADLLETRIALQDNRLNEVMKKVTSWAAIIAVPTAVTGFFGQNLAFPGRDATSGFVVSSVVLVLLGVGLYGVFKRNDWL